MINKVVVGGEVKLDLTGDTATPSRVLSGDTFHDREGESQVGTCTFDLDTSGATAKAGEILEGRTAGVQGAMVTGTLPNKSGFSGTITTKDQKVMIPHGAHDGSSGVEIAATEQAKIIPANIKQGVTILGQKGTYGGEAAKVESSKEVTPTFEDQTIIPASGYDYMAEVVVKKIPVTETPNAAGGTTLTIGG